MHKRTQCLNLQNTKSCRNNAVCMNFICLYKCCGFLHFTQKIQNVVLLPFKALLFWDGKSPMHQWVKKRQKRYICMDRESQRESEEERAWCFFCKRMFIYIKVKGNSSQKYILNVCKSQRSCVERERGRDIKKDRKRNRDSERTRERVRVEDKNCLTFLSA